MSVITQSSERRGRRSDRLTQALYLQLLQVAETFSLQAAVLADENGCLITAADRSTRDRELNRVLAAFSPVSVRNESGSMRWRKSMEWMMNRCARHGGFWRLEDVRAYEFFAGDRKLHLVVVGADPEMTEVGAFRAMFGVKRIWSSLR